MSKSSCRVRGACKAMNACSWNSQEMTAPLDAMKTKRDKLNATGKFQKEKETKPKKNHPWVRR